MLNRSLISFMQLFILLHFGINTVYALPSDTKAGHSDLTAMSADIKRNLDESNKNGLTEALGGNNSASFNKSLSAASVAEDDKLGGGLGGARHFYDPTTGKGYLDFQNAKDRAAEMYKQAVLNGCIGGIQKDPNYSKKAWDDFGHVLHLLQDMTAPAHTNDLSHITGDSYESYVDDNWDHWNENTPDSGKIQKSDGTYYNGLKDFLQDYPNNYPYNPAEFKLPDLSSYMDYLANQSHDSYVDKSLGYTNSPLTYSELCANAKKLLPSALMYGAGLINTFWDKVNPNKSSGGSSGGSGSSSGNVSDPDCNNPPDPNSPANDSSDDRFDVSDEFYYESNFNMSLDKLVDLKLRTGVKKGKIGVWYYKKAIDGVKSVFAATTDADRMTAQAALDDLGWKIRSNAGQYSDDTKKAPDIAIFANGYYDPAISLMLKIGEPATFENSDFNPAIVKDQPVMVVPTGGFYGLANSSMVKASLDEYVKNGGTLVVFAQQHNYDWGLLPTPADPVTGEKNPFRGMVIRKTKAASSIQSTSTPTIRYCRVYQPQRPVSAWTVIFRPTLLIAPSC